MNLSKLLADHFRQVFFGGNWTSVNLKETLSNVDWQLANKKVQSFNTIASLVFHINYYVSEVLKVLKGEPLNAHDKFSFAHDPINSQADWKNLIDKTLADAESFAALIEQLPEGRLWEKFSDEKYGHYYRNIQGIIEHTHYHLGQIVLIKRF